MHVFDLRTNALLGRITTSGLPKAIAFSNEGAKLAVAGLESISLYDLRSFQITQELPVPEVHQLAFVPNMATLASISLSQERTSYFHVVRFIPLTARQDLAGDQVIFAPANETACVLNEVPAVSILDADSLKPTHEFTAADDFVVSPDGDFAAVMQDDGRVLLWNFEQGKSQDTDCCLPVGAELLFVDNAGVRLSYRCDKSMLTRDLAENALLSIFELENGKTPVAWSPEGTAFAAMDGTSVKVWSRNGELLREFAMGTGGRRISDKRIAFHPAGLQIAWNDERGLALGNLDSGEVQRFGTPSNITTLRYSADASKLLAAGSVNKTAGPNAFGSFVIVPVGSVALYRLKDLTLLHQNEGNIVDQQGRFVSEGLSPVVTATLHDKRAVLLGTSEGTFDGRSHYNAGLITRKLLQVPSHRCVLAARKKVAMVIVDREGEVLAEPPLLNTGASKRTSNSLEVTWDKALVRVLDPRLRVLYSWRPGNATWTQESTAAFRTVRLVGQEPVLIGATAENVIQIQKHGHLINLMKFPQDAVRIEIKGSPGDDIFSVTTLLPDKSYAYAICDVVREAVLADVRDMTVELPRIFWSTHADRIGIVVGTKLTVLNTAGHELATLQLGTGVASPMFSPDGRKLVYLQGERLKCRTLDDEFHEIWNTPAGMGGFEFSTAGNRICQFGQQATVFDTQTGREILTIPAAAAYGKIAITNQNIWIHRADSVQRFNLEQPWQSRSTIHLQEPVRDLVWRDDRSLLVAAGKMIVHVDQNGDSVSPPIVKEQQILDLGNTGQLALAGHSFFDSLPSPKIEGQRSPRKQTPPAVEVFRIADRQTVYEREKNGGEMAVLDDRLGRFAVSDGRFNPRCVARSTNLSTGDGPFQPFSFEWKFHGSGLNRTICPSPEWTRCAVIGGDRLSLINFTQTPPGVEHRREGSVLIQFDHDERAFVLGTDGILYSLERTGPGPEWRESSFGDGARWGSCISISNDRRFLAVGTRTGCVAVWEIDTGRRIARFFEHRADVTALAFTPDSAILASGDSEGTVRVWRSGSNNDRAR